MSAGTLITYLTSTSERIRYILSLNPNTQKRFCRGAQEGTRGGEQSLWGVAPSHPAWCVARPPRKQVIDGRRSCPGQAIITGSGGTQ